MKGVPVAVGVDPPRTHDIADLLADLREETPFRDRLSALCSLTPYATGFRYPTPHEPPPLPTRDRLEAWIVEIETLKADFERWLAQREAQP